jgi:hypothetical protein
MPYASRSRLEGDQPAWLLDRRTILQSAGAFIGASVFSSKHSALAQDAGAVNAKVPR